MTLVVGNSFNLKFLAQINKADINKSCKYANNMYTASLPIKDFEYLFLFYVSSNPIIKHYFKKGKGNDFYYNPLREYINKYVFSLW